MNPRQSLRRTTAILVSAAVAVALAAAPMATVAADEETEAFWQKVFGKQLKLKGTPIVHVDATGDPFDASDGQPHGGPAYADATDFAYLTTKLTKAQVNALAKKQRGKKVQAILGSKAAPKAGQTWFFVGARTAKKMPKGVPGGVQFFATFDGKDPVPRYGSGSDDAIAGSETMLISGQYDGFDQLLSGTTRTSGTARGGRPEYNNKPSQTSGYYENGVWLIGVPLPKGARAGSFSFQAIDGNVQVIDQLTTPGGVGIFPLAGPAVPDDFCFSGGIFPLIDDGGKILDYQFELAIEAGQPLTEQQLAAISVVNVVDGDSTPAMGGWQAFPELNGAYGNFTLAPGLGQIEFNGWELTDEHPDISGAALLAGQPFDLSGTESGLAFGSRQCALLPSTGGVSEAAGTDWANYLGLDPNAIAHFTTRGGDGSDVRIVFSPEEQQALAVMVAGNRPVTATDFERMVSTSFCDPVPVDIGDMAIRAICPDGTHRLFSMSFLQGENGPLDYGRIFSVDLLPAGFAAAADGEAHTGFDLPLDPDAIQYYTSMSMPLIDYVD